MKKFLLNPVSRIPFEEKRGVTVVGDGQNNKDVCDKKKILATSRAYRAYMQVC